MNLVSVSFYMRVYSLCLSRVSGVWFLSWVTGAKSLPGGGVTQVSLAVAAVRAPQRFLSLVTADFAGMSSCCMKGLADGPSAVSCLVMQTGD